MQMHSTVCDRHKQWSVVRGQWPVAGGQWSAASRSTAAPAVRRASLFTVHRPRTTDRGGFTLVELLVVIAIISAVTIATIPLLLPALDMRRIREAARLVSTHFSSAQSDALAKGRSVGVWIERLSSEPTAAMDLFLCEVPPPYAGDSMGSLATCRLAGGKATVSLGADTGWYGLLKPGDLIRFNYGGDVYQFNGMAEQTPGSGTFIDATQESPAGSGNFILKPDNTLQFQIVWTNVANSTFICPPVASAASGWHTPYQIYRQPVKSATPPLQLPAGSVIDLAYSGTAGDTFQDELPTSPTNLQTAFPTDKRPIIVTFNKSGRSKICTSWGKRIRLPIPSIS